MAVLRIGGQEVRSKWARKSDGSPSWSEKLMLCWDGNMPLNIDMYGGKDHVGQVISSYLFLLVPPNVVGADVVAVVVLLLSRTVVFVNSVWRCLLPLPLVLVTSCRL